MKRHLTENHLEVMDSNRPSKDNLEIRNESESLQWDLQKLSCSKGSRGKVKNGEKYCFRCKKEFSTWKQKIIHILSVHESKSPFKCPKCGCGSTNDDVIVKHVKSCDKGQVVSEVKNFRTCNKCPMLCISELALAFHAKYSHSEQKSVTKQNESRGERAIGNLICDTCKQTFTSELYLAKHMHSAHSIDVEVECKLCKKVFDSPLKLKEHQV